MAISWVVSAKRLLKTSGHRLQVRPQSLSAWSPSIGDEPGTLVLGQIRIDWDRGGGVCVWRLGR